MTIQILLLKKIRLTREQVPTANFILVQLTAMRVIRNCATAGQSL